LIDFGEGIDMIKVLNPTMNFQAGNVAALPFLQAQLRTRKSLIDTVVREAVQLARTDWDSFETSWDFQKLPVIRDHGTNAPRSEGHTLSQSQAVADAEALARFQRMKQLEEDNNRLFIEAYGLQDESSPEITEDQITLYRPNREEDIKRLISYAIGCMMGRYSLDKPGLMYAHSGNKGFDPNQYQTFPADADGIIPIMETDWFPDDASNRLVEFIRVAWPKEHLEENLTFIADSLSPNRDEQPRDTIRRYLATGFYKHHLAMYKRRPIYWLFSSGKHRAFQCLVYLHRYHEGTLSRMRTEYVIPLQGKIASRMDQLADDIAAASSTSHRKKLEKERDTLRKQHTELQVFDEQLRHYADRRISLDLDDGVKVNYGKFGNLLAEVKAVTGESAE
jgi:type II restriction/modification system DNA methylase subunit YeeA